MFRARPVLSVIAALVWVAMVPRAAASPPVAEGNVSFSGWWAVKKLAAAETEGEGALAGLPLEALVDANRLEIVDDGSTVQVTYPSGRKRILRADGQERLADEGDGPARIRVERKGVRGERLLVSSRLANGTDLAETWELFRDPRRLTVSGKVSGRFSHRYDRAYEATPPPQPSPTPTPPASLERSVPIAGGSAVTPPSTPAPAPRVDRMSECSVKPPFGATPAELARLAKLKSAEASRRAVASVAPQRVASVIASGVEVNDGCLVYPFDLHLEGRAGFQEVLVDAGDGKVLRSRFEEPIRR